MDYSILQQLLRQAISDIKEFIPEKYFDPCRAKVESESELVFLHIALAAGLSPYTSQEKIMAFRASKIGALILHRNEYVDGRQYAACKLLIPLGELIVIEANKISDVTKLEIQLEPELEWLERSKSTDSYRSLIISDFHDCFIRYLNNLSDDEKRPLIPLLKEDPKQLEPKNEIIKGVNKQQVINAFAGMHFTERQWKKYLGDPPEWLKKCRVMTGNKSTSALWNPILIAKELHDKNIPVSKLNNVFRNKLQEWNAEWQDEPISYLQED